VLLGNYTKLSKYLIEHDKIYRATICFGEKRATGDSEGEIIKRSYVIPQNEEQIKEVLKTFLGKQMQVPPIYSAIKVNGKKLYEYARNGEEVKIEPRPIEIYKLDFLNFNMEEKTCKIEIACSKGTYIRTLCEDISERLGTCGYMRNLERIKVDSFLLENAKTLEELEQEKLNQDFLKSNIITMEKIFEKYPKLELNKRKLELFLNGVMLTIDVPDGVYNIYSDKVYIGLGTVKNKLLKRDVVIK
jgi:tRNA pseudouridine55 synthase